MPGQNLIQSVGGSAQKQTRFVSLFTSRWFNGFVSNRNPLRGPLGFLYTDYYHAGTTDVLIDGLNSELSTRLTMIRRPGNPKFSLEPTTSAVDAFYSFHRADGTIQVIADTLLDIEYTTPTTNSLIWTKTPGSGQGYFQGVNESLYIGDGIDLIKYIPVTTNPTNQFGQGAGNSVWLFSPVAPLIAPTLTVTESGQGGVSWAASTFFSTMGLIVDSNNNIQQLISVNALLNNATQFGTSGNGQPNWNQATGGVTSDNGISWLNVGPITLWQANTSYTATAPIYDPVSGGIYVVWGSSSQTSGNTRPNFNGIPGIRIHDSGGFEWGCLGNITQVTGNAPVPPSEAIFPWFPSTAYQQYDTGASSIVEPIALPTALGSPLPTTTIYLQITQNAGTSGSNYTPPWGTAPGVVTLDNQLLWLCLGTKTWASSTAYTAPSTADVAFSAIVDTNGNFQVCSVSGVSGSTQPNWNRTSPSAPKQYGDTTNDGTVTWVCVGSASHSAWIKSSIYYLPAIGFSLPSPTNPYGGAVVFDNGSPVDIEFCISSGFSGSSQPTWATAKGSTTSDSAGGGTDVGVTWVNGGAFTGLGFSWTKGYGYVYCYKSRAANDPDVTIAPPLATVVPNNPNVTGPLGPPTGCQDGSVSTASPVGYFGFPTASPNAGGIITVSGKYSQDPAVDTIMIFRSTDGFQTSGPYLLVTEINNVVSKATSPTIPTTGLWNIFDFMSDLPSVIDGITFPGLNELIAAPIDHANDPVPGQFGSTQYQGLALNGPPTNSPGGSGGGGVLGGPGFGRGPGAIGIVFPPLRGKPPKPEPPVIIVAGPVSPAGPNPINPFPSTPAGTGAIGFVYHQGRLWAFIGNNVFASGGPDTIVGNGFTAWPPTNTFPFQSNVTALLSTTSGLLVWTTTGLYIIAGGPAITTYYSQLLVDGLGLLSPNCLTLMAGIPYVFTSDSQLIGVEPGTGITRAGHAIGDKLVQFDPTSLYLTYHSFGDLDHALFMSDGVGQWYRCDTNLAPDSQYVGPVWSPQSMIAGGFQAVTSIETQAGLKQLLIGPPAAGFILTRDSTFTIFADSGLPGTTTQGNSYESFFTMGSIVLATAGQKAELGFICGDFIQTGSQPTVSVLLDEISATNGAAFESISNSFVTDPPKLYGPTALPATIWSNRYYFSQTTPANPTQVPAPAWCKHLQIKVDFGATDIVQNEMLAFSVWGALWTD